ncbi:MAG: LytTR family DNA-binding domain-containing protein, partial [Halioglobus sp.]|nr:LytTR family DNA-binding domain-containing protein [Halioglobus sp.]
IRHGAAVRIVEHDHIAWLESVQGYCRVWLSESGQRVHKQKSLISDTSLAQTSSFLPETQFLLASRSAIINAELVVSHWTAKRQMFVVLDGFNDQPITVSRRNASLLRQRWALR